MKILEGKFIRKRGKIARLNFMKTAQNISEISEINERGEKGSKRLLKKWATFKFLLQNINRGSEQASGKYERRRSWERLVTTRSELWIQPECLQVKIIFQLYFLVDEEGYFVIGPSILSVIVVFPEICTVNYTKMISKTIFRTRRRQSISNI